MASYGERLMAWRLAGLYATATSETEVQVRALDTHQPVETVTDRTLARLCSGRTMVCTKCHAIGGGVEGAHRSQCGGKWEPVTGHSDHQYETTLASDRWQTLRESVIAEQGYVCGRRRCEVRAPLELHHLTYERLGKENRSDVVALCKYHHDMADRHRREAAAFRTWHSKRYGEDSEVFDWHEDEFRDWIDRRQW